MEEENPRALRGYLEKAKELPIIGPIISNDYVQIGMGVGGALALNFLLGDPIGLKSEERPNQEYRAEARGSESPTFTQPRYEIEKPSRFKNAIKKEGPTPSLPYLIEKYEREGGAYCSEFVRVVGDRRHGKEFAWSDAWNRPYRDKLVSWIEDPAKELPEMAESQQLKPGMVIGAIYPGSTWTMREDENGNKVPRLDDRGRKVEGTHNLIYRGVEGNRMYFSDHVREKQRDISLKEMLSKGIIPTFVVDSRN